MINISKQPETVYHGSEIAIIGISCKFPGADHYDEFWHNLENGVESITFFHTDNNEQPANQKKEKANELVHFVPASPMINGADEFDAAFFGYTSLEAEIMDPQQRILLECSWEALENAGYDAEQYEGAVGVFVGCRMNTYVFNLISHAELKEKLSVITIGAGNDFGLLAPRISYKMNLTGPSYSLHTGCSTSLVNLHLACQSLLIDECQMAIAGGVSVYDPQKTGYAYQPGGMLSPDGHCRPYDEKASGTVFGSGAGAVILKRLEDAIADGDYIHAVIKGSATNNDGVTKASFTAPGVEGQATVIKEAISNAGVDPESISYIEGHGSSTALGDSIEFLAMKKAFIQRDKRAADCAIGSVKSNVGHLEAAAGMAGLIKTVMSLKHKQLPPSLHFERPNPEIDFARTPFYVNTELKPWAGEYPRRAGVSASGMGGTNAHDILEEA
ncbi:type I polyketide synthase, partial [Paenibacillus sp. GbtcB18]|uniref:type I polyketide synthase n=1 Tax=Paenibacillus sp. GbtcB18 TaxID=2824763 RepID=UPI001C2FD7EA